MYVVVGERRVSAPLSLSLTYYFLLIVRRVFGKQLTVLTAGCRRFPTVSSDEWGTVAADGRGGYIPSVPASFWLAEDGSCPFSTGQLAW